MTQEDRRNGLIGNTAMKVPVRAATTVAITLSGLQTVDGVVLAAGDRVLVKNQASGVDNGIYEADTATWNRTKDCDGIGDLVTGTLVRVTNGSTNLDSYWEVATTGTITPGTTSLTWTISSSALVGVSALMQAANAATTQAAVAAILGVPLLADAVLKALFTTKGDLPVATTNGVVARFGAGADGSILSADSTQTSGLVWLPQFPLSLAPNPFFQVDQRANSATSRADDVYAFDRWYVLTQSNPVTATQQSDQENGQPYGARLTQSNASAQRFGMATILEGRDCKHLRGQQVTFRPRVRISNSQAVRIAILEWTGTEDTVTSDVVNDWTSSTFTAGNFFNSTTLTVSGVGTKTPAGATWTDMDALTVTLGSTFNNLILIVWVEAVAAQNVTLDIGKIRFVPGSYSGDIMIPRISEVMAQCLRTFYRAARGLNTDTILVASCQSTTNYAGVLSIPNMRGTPSGSVSAATDFEVLESAAALNCSAMTINNSGGPANGRTVIIVSATVAGATAGRAGFLRGTGVNARMDISADL